MTTIVNTFRGNTLLNLFTVYILKKDEPENNHIKNLLVHFSTDTNDGDYIHGYELMSLENLLYNIVNTAAEFYQTKPDSYDGYRRFVDRYNNNEDFMLDFDGFVESMDVYLVPDEALEFISFAFQRNSGYVPFACEDKDCLLDIDKLPGIDVNEAVRDYAWVFFELWENGLRKSIEYGIKNAAAQKNDADREYYQKNVDKWKGELESLTYLKTLFPGRKVDNAS